MTHIRRLFLGIRPPEAFARYLSFVADDAGQKVRRIRDEHLHLTFCVISETRERDHFVISRVKRALDGQELASFPVPLGKVAGGSEGAQVRTIGRQNEIQDFYRTVVRLIEARGVVPMYRKSGLHPHVTLGYDPCLFDPFMVALEWYPNALLLIESEIGRTKHNLLASWPLLPPRQGLLPFSPSERTTPNWRMAS